MIEVALVSIAILREDAQASFFHDRDVCDRIANAHDLRTGHEAFVQGDVLEFMA